MNRQIKVILATFLVTAIAVSSLVIYQNSLLSPEEPIGSWQRPIGHFATALTSANGKVFTTDAQYNVNCYDAKTGRSIWNGSGLGLGALIQSELVVSEGIVCGAKRHGAVGCLDEATGQFKWIQYGTAVRFHVADTVIVNNGRVFAVSAGFGGYVIAINASTGDLIWEAVRYYGRTVGNITDLKNWRVSGFPLVGNTFDGSWVYCIGGNASDVYFFKLDTKNGNILWQTNTESTLETLPIIIAITQRQVIIANITQLISLDETSGKILWTFDVGASIYQATSNGNLLFFGAGNGNLYAVNVSEGKQVWISNIDSKNLLTNVDDDKITLTTYPIQIDTKNNRLYWSFGVTQKLVTSSSNKNYTYTGVVCSLDLPNGNLTWIQVIENKGSFYSPSAGMVVNKGTVYLTEHTSLWILDASTGNLTELHRFDHFVLPPVKDGDQVFIAGDLWLTACT